MSALRSLNCGRVAMASPMVTYLTGRAAAALAAALCCFCVVLFVLCCVVCVVLVQGCVGVGHTGSGDAFVFFRVVFCCLFV
jgi:hypothetical protein